MFFLNVPLDRRLLRISKWCPFEAIRTVQLWWLISVAAPPAPLGWLLISIDWAVTAPAQSRRWVLFRVHNLHAVCTGDIHIYAHPGSSHFWWITLSRFIIFIIHYSFTVDENISSSFIKVAIYYHIWSSFESSSFHPRQLKCSKRDTSTLSSYLPSSSSGDAVIIFIIIFLHAYTWFWISLVTPETDSEQHNKHSKNIRRTFEEHSKNSLRTFDESCSYALFLFFFFVLSKNKSLHPKKNRSTLFSPTHRYNISILSKLRSCNRLSVRWIIFFCVDGHAQLQMILWLEM